MAAGVVRDVATLLSACRHSATVYAHIMLVVLNTAATNTSPVSALTLPYGEDVLPPSAQASNGPNAHPRINRKVTKSPSAILTWVHTNTWNHPPP